MKKVLGILFGVLFFVTLVSVSAFASQYYTITDLGEQGEITPLGINNSGQIVGTYFSDINNVWADYAFLWTAEGGMQTLGVGEAFAINDDGQIAGYTYDPSNFLAPNIPFLYSDGSMTTIASSGEAFAINQSGEVAGGYYGSKYQSPFMYDNGTILDLSTYLGEYSAAWGINNSGNVVGYYSTNEGSHAFLYKNGSVIDIGAIDPLEDTMSIAQAINSSDQVVGYAYPEGYPKAFLYQSGKVEYLQPSDTQQSYAAAINDSGEVVGWFGNSFLSKNAFIWTKASGMVNLNALIDPSSHWLLQDATGINNKGQIIGRGIGPDGQIHGFLLSLTKVPASEKANDQDSTGSTNSQGASSNSNSQSSNGKK